MLLDPKLVVVRGGGDLATGIIFRLHRAGIPLVVLELAKPLVVRRLVSVANAVLTGEMVVEGMVARRVATVRDAVQAAFAGLIPLLVSPTLPGFPIPLAAVIDARMAKRNIDTSMSQAPLVIALGPGFTAGEDCHAVIETMRGHTLGRVIWQGSPLPDSGTPGIVAGKGAERVVRAPAAGLIQWQVDIGHRVTEGQLLGEVGGASMVAPFSGVVRGLIAPGNQVSAGLKVADIDARSDTSACFTISDKALAVGGGVLEAILTRRHRYSQAYSPPSMTLPGALDIGAESEIVSIVGGGGKSSLMFALAGALGYGCLTTTTTRIFAAQMKHAPAVVGTADLSPLGDALHRFGTALIVGARQDEKVSGVPTDLPQELLVRDDVRHVIVEADGSRMRPCKAPATHEPAIPEGTTLLIPTAGIDCLDKRLADTAHRPELVALLTGLTLDAAVTEEALAVLLAHPRGGLKSCPPQARVIPLLNKVESPTEMRRARRVAHHMLRNQSRISRVILAALQSGQPVREVQRRITAVVLAAGESERMGEVKQLLPWGERTVLGQTLHQLQNSLVHDILVVTGHAGADVARVVDRANVRLVENPDYAQGEMISSLQVALHHLSHDVGGVLVVLADQPMVEPHTINAILIPYWQGYGRLVAPTFRGRRGNPVLIDRHFFPELLALANGQPPRHVLQRHPTELYLAPVDTDAILRDLDTPQAYRRWRPSPDT